MHHIAHKYKIAMYKTMAYQFQSNELIKCSHHELMEYLKQWSKHNWGKYVTHMMKTYNTSIHDGTEYTPHELVFGRSARVPSSILPYDKDNESYFEYASARIPEYTIQPNIRRSKYPNCSKRCITLKSYQDVQIISCSWHNILFKICIAVLKSKYIRVFDNDETRLLLNSSVDQRRLESANLTLCRWILGYDYRW